MSEKNLTDKVLEEAKRKLRITAQEDLEWYRKFREDYINGENRILHLQYPSFPSANIAYNPYRKY